MNVVALALDPKANVFGNDYAANAARLPGAGLSWLDARRSGAMAAFNKTGVPTRRAESWKYTDVAAALDEGLEPAARFRGTLAERGAFSDIAETRVTLANGALHRIDGVTEGIEIVDLAALDGAAPAWIRDNLGMHAAGADQPLGALSLALMRGGVALLVRGQDRTLALDYQNPARGGNRSAHSRILIVLEESASLRLFESHAGEGTDGSFTNIGMEFVLSPGAKVEHVRMQQEGVQAIHVTSIGAVMEQDSQYRALYVALSARLSRVDANFSLAGKGAQAIVHNVAVLSDGIADTTTVMNHASPHTTSRQLFKSVVGGRGRSVAQGRVSVREGAVKSDSHQLFKAVLLSPHAEADAKPELEIFADDVVCGHGTAIGALESDALFYLRARGIPEEEAKRLLIRAFLAETIEGFGGEDLRAALWAKLDSALLVLGSSA